MYTKEFLDEQLKDTSFLIGMISCLLQTSKQGHWLECRYKDTKIYDGAECELCADIELANELEKRYNETTWQ